MEVCVKKKGRRTGRINMRIPTTKKRYPHASTLDDNNNMVTTMSGGGIFQAMSRYRSNIGHKGGGGGKAPPPLEDAASVYE